MEGKTGPQLTHDADFLNNKRFPPHGNAGVVLVRPGSDEGDEKRLFVILMTPPINRVHEGYVVGDLLLLVFPLELAVPRHLVKVVFDCGKLSVYEVCRRDSSP
jgi:hypothetical protein